jgi:hypothetical protein
LQTQRFERHLAPLPGYELRYCRTSLFVAEGLDYPKYRTKTLKKYNRAQ